MKVIVTGTGRCGTVYMARLLTSLGLPCGHESIFNLSLRDLNDRLINRDFKYSICSIWDTLQEKDLPKWVDLKTLKADSSYMAAPFLKHPTIADVPVIHVVRNPLQVISSFILDGEFFTYKVKDNVFFPPPKSAHLNKHVFPYEAFMTRHVPLMESVHSPVERACRFYIEWIKMIEAENNGTRKFLRVKIEDQKPVSEDVLSFLQLQKRDNVFSDSTSNSWKKRIRDYKLVDVPKVIRDEFVASAASVGYQL